MSTEEKVRMASEQFYSALSSMLNGDSAPLTQIWSHAPNVSTMHPIGGRQIGWDKVKESFEQVGRLASGGQAKLGDQMIHVVGEVAYELGSERGHAKLAGQEISIDHRVTNIYRLEGDTWKIIHHHTDVSPAMLDVVRRL